VQTFTDPDGTIKYLFELGDGNRVETVLLSDGKRKTLCVSTQAGCSMDCAFCATAKLKFQRNLTAAEIVDQANIIQKDKGKINNVVYMGMGEPLQNYDAVLKSLRILNHPEGKNIGIRHLTISTCGDADGIRKLAEEDIRPRLAISLNAPTDALRTKIMAINKKYPIAALFAAVKDYQMKTRERVTFEYVLIKGLNDSKLHAQMLAKLVRQVKCNVNLIEYNPHPHCPFTASNRQIIKRFTQVLEDAGIETTIRFKKGRKIKAACGQLGADLIGNKLQGRVGG
jgi:23S rRNA (adenine2503-C2)-methyltransferase